MYNLSSKIYFCYAWEDLPELLKFVDQLKHETDSEIEPNSQEENLDTIEEKIFPLIGSASVVLVFISDKSKRSEFIRQCALHAKNSNKRIFPILLGKNSLFVSTPDELKFRDKPVDLKDKNERAVLFGQLRSLLGTDSEGGDNYGTKVHISCSENVNILRNGKSIGAAVAGQDNVIRLVKGEHLLDFYTISRPFRMVPILVTIKSNEGDQFLSLDIEKELSRIKKEKDRKAALLTLISVLLVSVFFATGYLIYKAITTNTNSFDLAMPDTASPQNPDNLDSDMRDFLTSFFENYESANNKWEYLKNYCSIGLINKLQDEMEYEGETLGEHTFKSSGANPDANSTWHAIQQISNEGDGWFLVETFSNGYLIKVRVHVVSHGKSLFIDDAVNIYDQFKEDEANSLKEARAIRLNQYISSHNSNNTFSLTGQIFSSPEWFSFIMIISQLDNTITAASICLQKENDEMEAENLSGSWEANGYHLYNENVRISLEIDTPAWNSELLVRYIGTLEIDDGKYEIQAMLPEEVMEDVSPSNSESIQEPNEYTTGITTYKGKMSNHKIKISINNETKNGRFIYEQTPTDIYTLTVETANFVNTGDKIGTNVIWNCYTNTGKKMGTMSGFLNYSNDNFLGTYDLWNGAQYNCLLEKVDNIESLYE